MIYDIKVKNNFQKLKYQNKNKKSKDNQIIICYFDN